MGAILPCAGVFAIELERFRDFQNIQQILAGILQTSGLRGDWLLKKGNASLQAMELSLSLLFLFNKEF